MTTVRTWFRTTFTGMAGIGWAAVAAMAITVDATPHSHRWILITVAAASVTSILAGVSWLLTQGAQGAYQLGYRVGWDEGRSCERIMRTIVEDVDSNVTELPPRSRGRAQRRVDGGA